MRCLRPSRMASHLLRLKDLAGLDTRFLAPAAGFALGQRTASHPFGVALGCDAPCMFAVLRICRVLTGQNLVPQHFSISHLTARGRRSSWTLAEEKRVSLIIRSAIACPKGGRSRAAARRTLWGQAASLTLPLLCFPACVFDFSTKLDGPALGRLQELSNCLPGRAGGPRLC